jgi:type IV pilus assembly protein PilW
MKISINNQSPKSAQAKLAAFNQAGFSLIELMVGLVIGLIAAFVIINVFSTFENQKRTTTGTGDAQTNATIGLYNIQREVQKAGFGIPIFDGNLTESQAGDHTNNFSALRCVSATPATVPALPIDHDGLPGSPPVDGAIPISITDGVAGASDIITVGYSTPRASLAVAPALPRVTVPVPTTIVGQDLLSGIANSLEVINNIGCKQGDIAVVINGTNCSSSRVTTVNADLNSNSRRLQLTSIVGRTAGKLTCIGEDYNMVSFGVNANNELVRSGAPIISEIVNLQAQYGITAANNSNEVTLWVDAPALTDKNRIRAIRVAIVSRSGQLENNVVTNVAPISWAGGPAINLTANADWQRYRYRVYEAIIPVRNLAFSGALL